MHAPEFSTMFLAVVALLVGASRAEYTTTCSEVPKSSMSVMKSMDNVTGRYVVRYCSPADKRITKWELIINTIHQPKENCSYSILDEKLSGIAHSHSIEDIAPLELNCSHICYSKPMDLLSRSCYRVENKLLRGQMSTEPNNDYFFADNNITEYERDIPQFVNDIDYDDTVSFQWFEGHIPITDYDITIWPNDTHSEEATSVTRNCSRAARSVHCVLRLAAGCYTMSLRHAAPWTKGHSHLASYYAQFCHLASVPPSLPAPRGAAAWWGGGAALLLAAAALLALAARATRRRAKAKLHVLQDWRIQQLEAQQKATAAAAGAAAAGGGRVLLLYARDCAPAAALARAVRDMLNEVAGGQVYELYSPAVTALAAPAPAGWLRGALAAPDVRVLLLQTPALAALHACRLQDLQDTIKLSEPLLPRRVLYRSPHFGDTLLQYALQLLSESAHTLPVPLYKKYYLATVSELPVDVFPTVVPYTRFELPAACSALARALFPGANVSETAREKLVAAANDLVQYVREHPNYLADELMFL